MCRVRFLFLSRINKKSLVVFCVLSITWFSSFASSTATVVEVRKIWDSAPHNAFTSLIRYKNKWFLAFREASKHAVPDFGTPPGKIRVLTSTDGKQWRSAALITNGENRDLRDPHFSITPDHRLMLVAAFALHDKNSFRQSVVWLSDNGISWGTPKEIGEPNWWLWDISWDKDGRAFSIAYSRSNIKSRFDTRLYQSKEKLEFEPIKRVFSSEFGLSEASLLFRKSGEAVALIRQDSVERNAVIARATGDYLNWRFYDFGRYIGGPKLIELPSGDFVAGGRLLDNGPYTGLCFLDSETLKIQQILRLPSGGDTGYPGLVWYKDMLWVSYYSSHNKKARIYLAKIKMVESTMQDKIQQIPNLIDDKRVLTLINKQTKLGQKRELLLIRYTERHPDIVTIDRELKEIKAQIQQLTRVNN